MAKKKEQESPKYELNKKDMTKVGKGLLIATGGAILTELAQLLPQIDFGEYSPLVMVLASVLLNAGHKYLTGKKQ